VTEQQTAPAKANRAYSPTPVGAVGSTLAPILAFAASSLEEPVAVGGGEVAISLVWTVDARRYGVERCSGVEDGQTEIKKSSLVRSFVLGTRPVLFRPESGYPQPALVGIPPFTSPHPCACAAAPRGR
jgi:hypothetical protein